MVHELSVTSVHLQNKRQSWHPSEATVRNISKNCRHKCHCRWKIGGSACFYAQIFSALLTRDIGNIGIFAEQKKKSNKWRRRRKKISVQCKNLSFLQHIVTHLTLFCGAKKGKWRRRQKKIEVQLGWCGQQPSSPCSRGSTMIFFFFFFFLQVRFLTSLFFFFFSRVGKDLFFFFFFREKKSSSPEKKKKKKIFGRKKKREKI